MREEIDYQEVHDIREEMRTEGGRMITIGTGFKEQMDEKARAWLDADDISDRLSITDWASYNAVICALIWCIIEEVKKREQRGEETCEDMPKW
jgi:hypothetical protein